MRSPPADVPAERLFRDLLATPRPERAITFRFDAAPDTLLRVRAISAHEVVRGDACDVIAASLLSDAGMVFQSDAQAREILSEAEVNSLARQVFDALSVISPIEGRAGFTAWHERLLEGARHFNNRRLALGLGGSFDVTGRFFMPHPERFFDIPAVSLVDCHHFAFRAANAFFFECNKTK